VKTVFFSGRFEALTAIPTLQGCFGKLARAEKLINELRRQNLNFFEKGDCKSEIVRNPDTGRQQRVATKVQAPPVSHSFIVGDILYNLRSCLDHLVHQSRTRARSRPTGPMSSRSS
jgi:hypothetical protein